MSAPLVVSGLRKQFGKLRVLEGVDMTLDAGQVTAVVGPNAAGKSTLIKCVLGLVRADAGSIAVLGETIGADPHYRRFIGYMPQAARFPDNLTGDEVLALLADLRGGETPRDDGLRASLGLTAETLARPVRTLSGGTRQKLSAIVALRHEAPILVLDEPTAGLDPLTSSHLKDLVRHRAATGAAVLLTSHVMAEVEELADVLIYLVDGHVRFRGSLDELRLKTGQRRVEHAIAHLMREVA
jgi:Cu-processing system ATP-binding protein